METKQDVIDDIVRLIGTQQMTTSTGSTEPKALLLAIHRRYGLRIDPSLSKPALAEAIARTGGVPWDPSCDSRQSSSGGGSTITLEGLRRLREAVQNLHGRMG